MKKKTLNKDIRNSLRQSKGRFLSIMLLMMLGAFSLVGLKVSGPDIEDTLNGYMEQANAADLFVVAGYGLSDEDQAEIKQENADVEFGYFVDTVISDTPNAIRVFSQTTDISTFELVSGEFPTKSNEVALAQTMADQYKIGDTIRLNESGSSTLLKEHEFTITGFVNSSELLSKTIKGVSSAGSGDLSGFAVVPKDTFDSEVYTIARLRYPDLRKWKTTSREYADKVAQLQQALEEKLADNGAARLDALKTTADDKISEGKEKIADAKTQLSDAEKKLTDGKSEIEKNEKTLANGQKEVADNEATIASGDAKLNAAWNQLEASRVQLESARVQIEQAVATLAQKKTQLDDASAKLTEAETQLAAKKEELASGQEQLEAGKTQLAQAKAQLEADKVDLETKKTALAQGKALLASDPAAAAAKGITKESLQAMETALTQAEAQLTQTEATLNAKEQVLTQKEQELTAGQTTISNAEAELASKKQQLLAGQEAYRQGLAKYYASYSQYVDGLDQYREGVAAFEANAGTLEEGKAKLAEAKKTLADGEAKLADAKTQLKESEETYNEKKETADKDIEKAESELEKAEVDVSKLTKPKYSVYTRSTMLGSEGFFNMKTTAEGITSVGNLFPIVLYAVAALVTVTTMTRFVNEERINAGVLKALGYETKDVMKKFAVYGFTAGVSGTVLGILLGTYALPSALGATLMKDTVLPSIQLNFHPLIAVIAIVCSLICSVVPPLWIARHELHEQASALLLPKAPVAGSKILLERIPFIWNRLSFTHKVTARNIFRYKQRMFMTIFGVAGSVALLFAGRGILGSLDGIADRQFKELITYDAIVSKESVLTDSEQTALQNYLTSSNVTAFSDVYSESVTREVPGVDDEQSITVLVGQEENLSPYLHLNDAKTKKAVTLPESGALISEKLAKLLNVQVGDTFTLPNKDGEDVTLTVGGIVEMYAGHFVIMTPEVYAKTYGEMPIDNAIFVQFKDKDASSVQKAAADLMALDGVKAVVQNTSMVSRINTIVGSLSRVMMILTAVSILLAVVILYNLTNINVAERIRELSTIKVLGFLNKEVTMYIYRETILLSVIGIVVGLLFGRVLHRVIIETVAPGFVMFNPAVRWFVYVLPSVIVIVILVALGYMVNHLLQRIDMLEALKSVD
ncbi:FtsX-like permease family protein [Granulicatella adiacens]|uniref:FtsX-like permease family protein n=1 Tax=Granulicatella adiacens TaxID=46124 RepID=UPI0021A59B04|nr:FtsX-like permease family protein [Granulicatella adiacens]MCT2160510.1 FtsX-like permease family protein [Granulicatella adiacens]